MNKKLGILLGAFIFLFPCAAKADIDFASIIQDKLSTVEEDVNKVLKQYTNIQIHIQEFRNNRDVLKVLKNKAKQEIAKRKAKLIKAVRSQTVSLSGISGNLNMGDFAGVNLVSAVKSKYTKKKDVNNDFEEVRKHQEKINKMLVENVTTLYASALVRRLQLQEEGEELDKEQEEHKNLFQNKSDGDPAQLGPLKDAYTTVKNRADGRWKTVLKTMADHKGLIMNGIIAENRINSEEEALSELEKAAEEQKANEDPEEPQVKLDLKGPTIGQLWDLGSKTIKDIDTNNWWKLIEDAGGGYGTVTGQSTTSKWIKAATGAAAGAGRKAGNGNYSGALESLAKGGMSTGKITGNQSLKDVADTVLGGTMVGKGNNSTNKKIDGATKILNGLSGQGGK